MKFRSTPKMYVTPQGLSNKPQEPVVQVVNPLLNKLQVKKKSGRGGKRIGAGRKGNGPTVILSYRVLKSLAPKINEFIKDLLSKAKEGNYDQ